MKRRLRNLIADGKTHKVIAELRSLDKPIDEDLQENILIQANRFNTYFQNKNLGKLSSEQEGIQLNHINTALLAIISQLPEDNSPSIPLPRTTPSLPWLAFALISLLISVIAILLPRKSHLPEEPLEPIIIPIVIDSLQNDTLTDSGDHPDDLTDKPSPSQERPIKKDVLPKDPKALKTTSLQVRSNSQEFENLFQSHASRLLNSLGVSHSMGGNAHSGQKVEFDFQLEKFKTQSGIREVIEYSLNVFVKSLNHENQSCATQSYSTEEPQIGYPQDSQGSIQRKVLGPLLKELEKAMKENPPKLCSS